ncbi:MAG: glycoside hydrolase family 38 C-terminal domain-containing protein [Candidatus Limiplasma sp.]|nr:glycoside hydrolase family 38 C-terminal domain-containing protein [Candidatus Limiplasma sp.]
MPAGERERETTLELLSKTLDLLDLRSPHSEAFDASVEKARNFLEETFYAKRAQMPPEAIAECVGHTHIDIAWLWDMDQTRHKAARSFSTVLRLMEEYPEYKFMSSQAILYQMVKEDEPALYARIQQAVREGRWEVEGGMWVEADCNLAGGEALARQLLYGQAFFQREFGVRCRILWLPDVFGYSAALPQLLKQAGIDFFMTTKLSWSEFNKTPYDTFLWQGIDGSEVLTHFSPSRDYVPQGQSLSAQDLSFFTTYNAMLAPGQIKGGWQRFQQKELDDHFLVTFGYGDGGGGPTDWMMENARRMHSPLPGCPSVRMGHARDFFEALHQRVTGDPRLPCWSGELYLEYHRGTYTAMGRNKRSNRKMELLLREVELWRSVAQRQEGLPYPKERLEALWLDVLTMQFHDILPGSSIQKVYEDSASLYATDEKVLEGLLTEGITALSQRVAGDVLAFNALSHIRDDMLWFDAPETVTALRDAHGRLYPVQHVQSRACAFVQGLLPMGITAFWFDGLPAEAPRVAITPEGFRTPHFEGIFDEGMRIKSLIDKRADRQVARQGEVLNRLVCYENKPHNFDAWDINIYYKRRCWEIGCPTAVEVLAEGPVLGRLRVTYSYMNSTIQQIITVYHDLPRIDFDTQVDWKEKQYLLKAHFPVDVFYKEATYDIQFGNLTRPTHQNTSWDKARFEVCAHRWMDVSEQGYGVSLLNDCKYGYAVDERGMSITLLKSSIDPNPAADQETHHFTYALWPHQEGWREGQTNQSAAALNNPVRTALGMGEGAPEKPFASVDAPNVIIETVKEAEDGRGTILRLYECHGRRTQARVRLGAVPSRAALCNLLEEAVEQVPFQGRQISLLLHPYQILTLRIEPDALHTNLEEPNKSYFEPSRNKERRQCEKQSAHPWKVGR